MAFHGVNGIIEIVQHYFFRFVLLVHAHAALVRCFYMLVYIYREGVNEDFLSKYCLPLASKAVLFNLNVFWCGSAPHRRVCLMARRFEMLFTSSALGIVLHGVVDLL